MSIANSIQGLMQTQPDVLKGSAIKKQLDPEKLSQWTPFVRAYIINPPNLSGPGALTTFADNIAGTSHGSGGTVPEDRLLITNVTLNKSGETEAVDLLPLADYFSQYQSKRQTDGFKESGRRGGIGIKDFNVSYSAKDIMLFHAKLRLEFNTQADLLTHKGRSLFRLGQKILIQFGWNMPQKAHPEAQNMEGMASEFWEQVSETSFGLLAKKGATIDLAGRNWGTSMWLECEHYKFNTKLQADGSVLGIYDLVAPHQGASQQVADITKQDYEETLLRLTTDPVIKESMQRKRQTGGWGSKGIVRNGTTVRNLGFSYRPGEEPKLGLPNYNQIKQRFASTLQKSGSLESGDFRVLTTDLAQQKYNTLVRSATNYVDARKNEVWDKTPGEYFEEKWIATYGASPFEAASLGKTRHRFKRKGSKDWEELLVKGPYEPLVYDALDVFDWALNEAEKAEDAFGPVDRVLYDASTGQPISAYEFWSFFWDDPYLSTMIQRFSDNEVDRTLGIPGNKATNHTRFVGNVLRMWPMSVSSAKAPSSDPAYAEPFGSDENNPGWQYTGKIDDASLETVGALPATFILGDAIDNYYSNDVETELYDISFMTASNAMVWAEQIDSDPEWILSNQFYASNITGGQYMTGGHIPFWYQVLLNSGTSVLDGDQGRRKKVSRAVGKGGLVGFLMSKTKMGFFCDKNTFQFQKSALLFGGDDHIVNINDGEYDTSKLSKGYFWNQVRGSGAARADWNDPDQFDGRGGQSSVTKKSNTLKMAEKVQQDSIARGTRGLSEGSTIWKQLMIDTNTNDNKTSYIQLGDAVEAVWWAWYSAHKHNPPKEAIDKNGLPVGTRWRYADIGGDYKDYFEKYQIPFKKIKLDFDDVELQSMLNDTQKNLTNTAFSINTSVAQIDNVYQLPVPTKEVMSLVERFGASKNVNYIMMKILDLLPEGLDLELKPSACNDYRDLFWVSPALLSRLQGIKGGGDGLREISKREQNMIVFDYGFKGSLVQSIDFKMTVTPDTLKNLSVPVIKGNKSIYGILHKAQIDSVQSNVTGDVREKMAVKIRQYVQKYVESLNDSDEITFIPNEVFELMEKDPEVQRLGIPWTEGIPMFTQDNQPLIPPYAAFRTFYQGVTVQCHGLIGLEGFQTFGVKTEIPSTDKNVYAATVVKHKLTPNSFTTNIEGYVVDGGDFESQFDSFSSKDKLTGSTLKQFITDNVEVATKDYKTSSSPVKDEVYTDFLSYPGFPQPSINVVGGLNPPRSPGGKTGPNALVEFILKLLAPLYKFKLEVEEYIKKIEKKILDFVESIKRQILLTAIKLVKQIKAQLEEMFGLPNIEALAKIIADIEEKVAYVENVKATVEQTVAKVEQVAAMVTDIEGLEQQLEAARLAELEAVAQNPSLEKSLKLKERIRNRDEQMGKLGLNDDGETYLENEDRYAFALDNGAAIEGTTVIITEACNLKMVALKTRTPIYKLLEFNAINAANILKEETQLEQATVAEEAEIEVAEYAEGEFEAEISASSAGELLFGANQSWTVPSLGVDWKIEKFNILRFESEIQAAIDSGNPDNLKGDIATLLFCENASQLSTDFIFSNQFVLNKYIVKPGDNFLVLALELEVEEQTLMDLNRDQIKVENATDVVLIQGQELLYPSDTI